MTKRPTHNTPDGAAYLKLRALARMGGRPTIELIHLYALEGLLARIAQSDRREDLVLNGGMLLAAYGARRPTRDLDLPASRISNGVDAVRALVVELASIDLDDGLEFKTDGAEAAVIRDGSAYSGVRVTLAARLATAKIALHVDVDVGDPVEPPPTTIDGGRVVIRTRGKATATLSTVEFSRRFLLHVLPEGFRKVRHLGLLAPGNLRRLGTVRGLLVERDGLPGVEQAQDEPDRSGDAPCPKCGAGLIAEILRPPRGPPTAAWRHTA